MASRHADTDPVTWGDLRRVYKKLDVRINEAFEAITKGDDTQAEFWNEHEELLGRVRRAHNRLRRDVAALSDHTHEEE